MTGPACPLSVAWCVDHEIDGDGTHICQGEDRELPSGWVVTLADFHEGNGPELEINDPDALLARALVNRLSLDAAYDLMIALATVLRDAHKPGTLPQPALTSGSAA